MAAQVVDQARAVGSSGGHEGQREEVLAVLNGGSHEAEAARGGPVEATVLDLSDKAVAAELGDLARGMLAPATPFVLGARR